MKGIQLIDPKVLILGAGFSAGAIYIAIDLYEKKKEQDATRDKIRKETDDYIKSMHKAADRVREDIQSGKYDGKSIAEMFNDFQFYTMMNQE
jgi:hypothetical protein